MKIAGRKIEGANVEYVVLPRGDGEPLVFRAQAVLDNQPFEQLCPRPRPPVRVRPGGVQEANPEDPSYKAALNDYGRRRVAWLVITSLRLGMPDLEWETVDYGDPNTWAGYEAELAAAGFSEIEISRVIRACLIANALDDDKLDEARAAFLASRARPDAPSSSPAAGPSSTPSGGPASA